jgi:diphthine synthase
LKSTGQIVFVGLGLHDDLGISLRGIEETSTAKHVFIELYTSLLPDFSKKRLEKVTGKEFRSVSRKELEEGNGEVVLEAAKDGKVVLLVPGDPLVATTHVALRIAAEKRGIETRMVHGSSVLSAVIGLSGLHNYKFGKSVTIPFPDETPLRTPYEVLTQNRSLGLHTLCLLDIKAEQKRYLSIQEALACLLEIEKKRKMGTITPETLAIGISRAGSKKPTVKAGYVRDLIIFDFGEPPYSIIFPGELHFMEAEALIVLAGAPESIRRAVE